MYRTARPLLFPGLAAVAALVILFSVVDPIPQDLAYHRFVDGRTLLDIANFWNVVSNVPFLIVGLWGIHLCLRLRRAGDQSTLQYLVFFAGVFLTSFGSSYYHLFPGNDALIWDRLPMTIAFAGLIAIIASEYGYAQAARRILFVYLLVGSGSVIYWAWSEAAGGGDLRPYALVQFLPIILIPAVLLLRRPTPEMARYFWALIGSYVIAKLLEHFDVGVFAVLPVSGHSLKHIVAALGPAAIAFGLSRVRSGLLRPGVEIGA